MSGTRILTPSRPALLSRFRLEPLRYGDARVVTTPRSDRMVVFRAAKLFSLLSVQTRPRATEYAVTSQKPSDHRSRAAPV